jgi:DNA modification methylase
MWLNLGDTYAANRSYQVPQTAQDMRDVDRLAMPMSVPLGLKPKDQCLVPHRVAMALQADGWWLRDTIIWSKSNPMPSSVDDRCTPSFEYIFMLAKSHRYFADMDSVRTPLTEATINRLMQPNFEKQTGGVKDYANGTNPNNSMRKAIDNLGKKVRAKTAEGPNARGLRQAPEPGEPGAFNALGANLRNVWVIPTEPFTETRYECESCGSMFITGERIRDREDAPGEPDFKCRGCGAYVRRDSHFAVFPREIPSRCIRIGTSEAGCCAICGAPHRRVIAREVDDQRGSEPDADYADASGAHSRSRAPSTFYAQATSTIRTTAGFEPTCTCAAGTVPCRVLDVFGGSGTTAEVAQSLGRDWVLYEINPGYRDLIAARTQQMGLFAVSSPPAEVQP